MEVSRIDIRKASVRKELEPTFEGDCRGLYLCVRFRGNDVGNE